MKIIGTGCGPGMLTAEAIRAIRDAKKIYGSKRAIAMVQEYIGKDCISEVITNFRNLSDLPGDSVILSTGDPMLSGLGNLEGDVIPGISSLQVAAARLHLPLERISIVLAHGRDHRAALSETVEELKRGKIVFLVADPELDIPGFTGSLAGSGDITIALCEELGYPGERIAVGSIREPPVPGSKLFSLLIGTF